MKRAFACVLALLIVLAASLAADVKTQQKSQMKFEGTLGTVMGLFGGKAAKEGVVDTVVVSGDRKATMREDTGEIVDLGEEKVYQLDLKNKTYKVTTFDEIRRQMQEAQARAEKSAQRSEGRKADQQQAQKEYEVDFDVKDTGQRKTLNGFDCHETVTTITVHEKGKTVEQAGGVVMTADAWLAPRIPAMKEIMDFDLRYAQKLMGINAAAAAQQMSTALAMYPGMKEALLKYQASGASAGGTPILTTVTFASAKSADQVASEQKAGEQPAPGGLGGLMARRLARKKDDQPAGDKTRATIMTMTNEVMSVSTAVEPGAVAMPAGFKQK